MHDTKDYKEYKSDCTPTESRNKARNIQLIVKQEKRLNSLCQKEKPYLQLKHAAFMMILRNHDELEWLIGAKEHSIENNVICKNNLLNKVTNYDALHTTFSTLVNVPQPIIVSSTIDMSKYTIKIAHSKKKPKQCWNILIKLIWQW